MTIKPMWKEGLFMMPQHLQLLDAYHEHQLDSRINTTGGHLWGISELEFDADELARGVVQVSRCTAVMPDGLLVQLGTEQPIAGVTAMVPPGAESIDVYLGVPSAHLGGVAADATVSGARYLHRLVERADAYGEADPVDVDCVSPNVQLVLGTESPKNYVTIKIAELGLGESGELMVSERYVPPCLKIRASATLMRKMDQLVTSLAAKQKALVDRYGSRTEALVEFGAADMATFMYLHTVNYWLPLFMHYSQGGECHPERLFMALASLSLQLSSFEPGTKQPTLGRFNFTDLADTLFPLFDHAISLLGMVTAVRYTSIPLEQTQPGLFVGKVEDAQLLQKHQLFLIAGGDVPEDKLRGDLPKFIKVGSIDQISQIVHSALPGVVARVDLSPPSAIPVRAQMVYLQLERQGRYWDSVLHSGTIAIYQPVNPSNVSLELVAVEE